MNDVQKYTIEVLQELIKTNKDEYQLFESASRKSKDSELKDLFTAYAVQKQESISKLENEVVRLGGSSETDKITENSTEFYESSIFDKNWEKLIADCLMKDDLAINKYFYAIRKNIMWEVVPLIAKQYFGAKTIHDQIRNIYMERPGGLSHNMDIH
jgi:uncharacterized protein (TIGR02284 family)